MIKFSKKTITVVVVAAVLALSVVAGGVAYAVWDGTAKGIIDLDVDVSDNTELHVEKTLSDSNLKLLPTSASIIDETKETKKLEVMTITTTIKSSNDNFQIRWTYDECFMKDDTADPKTDYKKLFNIEIYSQDATGEYTVKFDKDTPVDTVKTEKSYKIYIVMNDPEDSGFKREDVMGKSFKFKITLETGLDKPE